MFRCWKDKINDDLSLPPLLYLAIFNRVVPPFQPAPAQGFFQLKGGSFTDSCVLTCGFWLNVSASVKHLVRTYPFLLRFRSKNLCKNYSIHLETYNISRFFYAVLLF